MPFEFVHTVKRGENLSKIGRLYGLSNPGPIATHPDNKVLFYKNRNFVIHPGDKLTIPWPEEKLRKFRDLLTRLIADGEATTQRLTASLLADRREVERIENNADIAAFLLTLGVGVGALTAKGLKGASMTNSEAIQWLVTDRLLMGHSIASMTVRPSGDSRIWRFIKRSALGFMSPSYYSSLYLAIRENDFDIAADGNTVPIDKAIRTIKTENDRMNARLRQKRTEVEAQMGASYYRNRI